MLSLSQAPDVGSVEGQGGPRSGPCGQIWQIAIIEMNKFGLKWSWEKESFIKSNATLFKKALPLTQLHYLIPGGWSSKTTMWYEAAELHHWRCWVQGASEVKQGSRGKHRVSKSLLLQHSDHHYPKITQHQTFLPMYMKRSILTSSFELPNTWNFWQMCRLPCSKVISIQTHLYWI